MTTWMLLSSSVGGYKGRVAMPKRAAPSNRVSGSSPNKQLPQNKVKSVESKLLLERIRQRREVAGGLIVYRAFSIKSIDK